MAMAGMPSRTVNFICSGDLGVVFGGGLVFIHINYKKSSLHRIMQVLSVSGK